MIVDERLVTYINSLDTGNTRILDAVERDRTRGIRNLCADRAQGNAEFSETDLIDKKTRKNP